MSFATPLLAELGSVLGQDPLIITSVEMFADLVWDSDMTPSEADELDRAVVIDHPRSWRRIVFQRVRGEVRYWLTTDRRAGVEWDSAHTELGRIESVGTAADLCREHMLTGLMPAALQTPREVGERTAP